MSDRLVKVGAGIDGPPVHYPDVWEMQSTTGPGRLRIGPSGSRVEVLRALAETWDDECWLLYILVVPAGGSMPGRYQLPEPIPFSEVEAFLARFRDLLEGDSRHHLWIESEQRRGLLVYDQHDWIWAYGDLATYQQVLGTMGFTEGEIILPSPHTHHYHPELNASLDELLGAFEWIHSPLQPGDEY